MVVLALYLVRDHVLVDSGRLGWIPADEVSVSSEVELQFDPGLLLLEVDEPRQSL